MRLDILRDPVGTGGNLSLACVVHDEMYFLPEFLRYYRGLGVERFVMLDDASTDGSREFLCDQPDCIVVTSDLRYFDRQDGKRAIYFWRQELMQRFMSDRWSFFVDADEFVATPPGLNAVDLTERLDARGARSAWGVMTDIYPRDVSDIRTKTAPPFSLSNEWYFDARPHIRVRAGHRKPIALYRGTRARLMAENRVMEPGKGKLHNLAVRLGLGGLLKLNQQTKVPLIKWGEGYRFDGSHRIKPSPVLTDVLAIMHFKFNSDLGRKMAYALQTGGYAGGSRQYRVMEQLLHQMETRGSDFLCRRSQKLTDPGDLYHTGVGRWST